MTLEPRVRRLVAAMNAFDRRPTDAPMAERRRAAAALSRRGRWLVMPAGPTMAAERDLEVPVAGGTIVVRLYQPHASGALPLHVFFHGGGWCVGTLYERDPRCRQIAAGARCAVASVDYRLAPENAYPTPFEDCYAAVTWLAAHAAEAGWDASRLSVGGESAGANLAAAVCLAARDRGGPEIHHQWLDVPGLDCTLSLPSMTEVPDGLLLDRAAIEEYRDAYLPDPSTWTDAYASPLLAHDLSGLPPAWIMSAGNDKLRDDGPAYAARLADAGVPVHQEVLAGHVHPSFAFTRLLPSARDYEQRAIAALRDALHG